MPWKESSVMEERLRFVARLLDGEGMSDVCWSFAISRKTGYKIYNRYKEQGLEALCDRSRRPVRYANQLPEPIEQMNVRFKREKPHWGARKIRELLVRRLAGDLRIPAMQQILGPIGVINMAMGAFGFEPIDALMYTNTASAIGLTYLWIPFMVLAIYLSLLNFDFDLLEVAKVNGARPLRAFWEVAWPLNRAGSAIGVVLVFIPTLSSAITSQFLGGPNGALYGNILGHQFGATGTWAFGSAMGVVLFAISLLVLYLVWKAVGDLKRSGITFKGGVEL